MVRKADEILIRKHFNELSFIKSDIESFNYFVEQELQAIIDENKEIIPTVIPQNVDDFKIKFDNRSRRLQEKNLSNGSQAKKTNLLSTCIYQGKRAYKRRSERII